VAEDDATNVVAPISPCCRHHVHEVLPALDPFELPDIGLDTGGLQFDDRVHHMERATGVIPQIRVATELIELRGLGWYQQLEKEFAPGVPQILRQQTQLPCLAAVHDRIAVGIVAHQYLAESGVDFLDVAGEIFPVLQLEFLPAASLGGTRRHVTTFGSVPKDVGAELFVYENSGGILRRPVIEGRAESFVDDLLCGGDLPSLRVGKLALPAK